MSKFTQQAIIDTFLKMLACKSLDKITVKEIVNECGINRNTFYYYYKDIYDLLEDVVSTESKKVIEEDGNSKTFYDECVRAFDVMMKYKNALLHIYNSRSRSVIEKYLMAVTPNFIRRFVTLNSENIEINENDGFEIEIRPFVKAVRQAGFAAASYETSNLLSGIVCDISENILEIASTDGNRLARVRETIDNKDNHAKQLIIPSKTLNEFIKMSSFIAEDSVKIYTENSKLIFKSEKTTTISRLLEGQFPKYNQLIPKESPKEAIVNVSQVISAIERVSIMVNEKTSIVKLEFSNNNLKLSADTPDSGKSEESLDIDYSGEELAIAFNYKYVLEALKNIDADEVKIGLNTPLSATMFRPNSEEDFVGLIMPVQIR